MNFPFEGNAAQQLVCFDVLTPFAWLAHYLMLSRNSIRQRYFRAPTMCYATDSLADDYCSVKWPFSQDVMSLGHALCCSSSVCAMIFKGREKTLMDHWLRLHVNPFLVLAATISPRCYFYIQLKTGGIFTLFLALHIKINVYRSKNSCRRFAW